MNSQLDELCINTIRMLSVDCVQQAKSGHPGLPMGAAPMAYILWTEFLRHNPANPRWADRDRFVLSAGHGSALLYSLLHLTGYDVTLEQLKRFRQWGSATPGHPEFGITPGVETTTGPLGQGLANAVGMAVAEQFLSAHFNRPGHAVVDHRTYALVSDGDLMEGVSHEAASLAGHLKLGKLILLYDDNRISIEGETGITYTEDRLARFAAYGWHVQEVPDGNDLDALRSAIRSAVEKTDCPSFLSIRTQIGYGSPNKQNRAVAHGEPLGEEEVRLTKENLKWPTDPTFFVPEEALGRFRAAVGEGEGREAAWQSRFQAYEEQFPEPAKQFRQWMEGKLPEGWEEQLLPFSADAKGMATRAASGKVLNRIAPVVENLMGGSADLGPSNKTVIENQPDFQAATPEGRNLRFGVREHGMGAILNGMALHGGVRPYGGTFLIFSDYMRPAIRLAALMGLNVVYIFTHDSIGLGEDGPTHQPVEQLAALRAIPNLTVIRPADANETEAAWRVALSRTDCPVALALTRQGVPVLDRAGLGAATQLSKGAYILQEPDRTPEVILLATGSEVHIALAAAEQLARKGKAARVVSMPSWELFEAQDAAYRERVLPKEISNRVAVEAGVPQGWFRYLGEKGVMVGVNRFGASAPYQTLYEQFGITADRVVREAVDLLDR